MNTTPVPVAILARVSTNKQDTARQVHELTQFAAANSYTVVATVMEEGISGSATTRPGLDEILRLAATGQIKKVLVHEVSRIARNAAVTLSFVEDLHAHKVSLFWLAQNTDTLLPDGRRSPAAGIMLALMAELARAEKETLVERINSGIAEARRKGVRLGRPPGSSLSRKAFLAKHRDIARLLAANHSLRNAAKISAKGLSTVLRVKAAMEAQSTEAA